MGFKCGIVGIPNAGKSTLFNALLGARKAEVANYPFCTIEPNVGVVEVPNPRLTKIAGVVKPKDVVPAVIEFVDVAGLVRGASKGEGLGNQFLSNLQGVHLLVHVVRAFKDPGTTHVEGDVNPVRDAEIVNLELILKDIETVERRLEKLKKLVKSHSKDAIMEQEFLGNVKEILESGRKLYHFMGNFNQSELKIIKSLSLLTAKPTIYVVNVDDGSEDAWKQFKEYAKNEHAPVLRINAKVEAELSELEPEERMEFASAFGVEVLSLDALIKESYRLLDLVTFFTVAGEQTRAWPVKRGTTARVAAGKIHSDMERGFVKAEVVNWQVLVEQGSFQACREKGLVRLEGRDYVVQDGDVIYFRFKE